MEDGIRISEKYGVNPTMPICYWCGQEKGEIALLGMLPGDVEAPRNMVLDYEPCDKCKEEWSKGVAIIEVTFEPHSESQPPISKGAYPTGRVVVIRSEATNGNFKDGDRALMLSEEFQESFCNNHQEDE